MFFPSGAEMCRQDNRVTLCVPQEQILTISRAEIKSKSRDFPEWVSNPQQNMPSETKAMIYSNRIAKQKNYLNIQNNWRVFPSHHKRNLFIHTRSSKTLMNSFLNENQFSFTSNPEMRVMWFLKESLCLMYFKKSSHFLHVQQHPNGKEIKYLQDSREKYITISLYIDNPH